jgi:peptidoglycan/LPS O-acetylase OafA/YrhL
VIPKSDPPKTSCRYEALDTLRYAFAAVVVFGHVSGWSRTFPGGGLAVDFFFVLSGFVLTQSLARENVSYGDFVVTRLARVYPLYLLSLFFVLAVWPFMPNYPDLNLFHVFANAALLQNVVPGMGNGYNYPSWSISSELWVNLTLLFLAARALSPALVALATLACYLIWFGAPGSLSHQHHQPYTITTIGMFRCAAGVLTGYLLFAALTYLRSLDRCLPRVPRGIWTLIEVASLCAIAMMFSADSMQYHYAAVLMMPLVILMVALSRGAISRLLSVAALRSLGNYSYGIYLLHVPVFFSLQLTGQMGTWRENTVLDGIVVLVVTTLLSVPIYHLLERPLLLWGKELVRKRRTSEQI